jgi:tRNA dimethylallyltransferase
LTRTREELAAGVSERIERQLEAGLVEEVRRALDSGLSKTSSQAIGVKEIVAYLEGRCTLEEAKSEFVSNAKNFVRRQLSWFGFDPRIEWVDVSELGWTGAREAIVERFGAATGR